MQFTDAAVGRAVLERQLDIIEKSSTHMLSWTRARRIGNYACELLEIALGQNR